VSSARWQRCGSDGCCARQCAPCQRPSRPPPLPHVQLRARILMSSSAFVTPHAPPRHVCMYIRIYVYVCMCMYVCIYVCGRGCVGVWVVGWLGGWVGEWACVHTYISKGPAQEWARRRGGRHGVLGAWLPGISGCPPQFEQSFRWACRRDVHVRGPDKSRTSVSAYFYYYVYYVYY
jgi:hypothetical protein